MSSSINTRITPFGGCLIHNPLSEFYRRHGTWGLYSKQNGWVSRPFSLSASTNLQLFDFMTGAIIIPDWIRSYIYFESFTPPTQEQTKLFLSGNIALVEMSTPIEYIFGDYLINVNQFENFSASLIEEFPDHKKVISKWHQSLKKADNDRRREYADQLCAIILPDDDEHRIKRQFVQETTSRHLSLQGMTKAMAELRDRLGIPTAMIIHNYSYMPDGRPISWPADFKSNSFEAARRLEMSTLDLAGYVQENGVEATLAFDRRHFADAHLAPIGKIMHDFCQEVLEPSAGVIASIGTSKRPDQASLMVEATSEIQSEEFRIAITKKREQLNAALNRARAIDRAESPRHYIQAWKDVLTVNPTLLMAIRRWMGGAAFIKDYAELYKAVHLHMEITPGDPALALKLASSAVRSDNEVPALDFLASQNLADMTQRPIQLLHKRVAGIHKTATRDGDEPLSKTALKTLERFEAARTGMELTSTENPSKVA